MVASGQSDAATVEVIDLLGDPSSTFCRNLPEFPQPNVTDGLAAIFNASPLICGGATDNDEEFSVRCRQKVTKIEFFIQVFESQKKCYHLSLDRMVWSPGPNLKTSRSQASILSIGEGSSKVSRKLLFYNALFGIFFSDVVSNGW